MSAAFVGFEGEACCPLAELAGLGEACWLTGDRTPGVGGPPAGAPSPNASLHSITPTDDAKCGCGSRQLVMPIADAADRCTGRERDGGVEGTRIRQSVRVAAILAKYDKQLQICD